MQRPWAHKSRMQFKTPPPTLLVFFESEAVAELRKVKQEYQFRYLESFLAKNLSPLPGIPARSDNEWSLFSELPTFFKERLPDMRRPEIRQWLQNNPSVSVDDDLQLLGTLGAHSIVDSFELRQPSAA